jgi:hypothetical protein
MYLRVLWIPRTLHFQNIVANANGGAFDVTPVADKFCTDLDIKSKSISKFYVFG